MRASQSGRERAEAPLGVDDARVSLFAENRLVPDNRTVSSASVISWSLAAGICAEPLVEPDRVAAVRSQHEMTAGADQPMHLVEPAKGGALGEMRPDRDRVDGIEEAVWIVQRRVDRARLELDAGNVLARPLHC